MSDQESAKEPDVLLTALEYLLDVRQSQLAEALSEVEHRGDSEWTHRLNLRWMRPAVSCKRCAAGWNKVYPRTSTWLLFLILFTNGG